MVTSWTLVAWSGGRWWVVCMPCGWWCMYAVMYRLCGSVRSHPGWWCGDVQLWCEQGSRVWQLEGTGSGGQEHSIPCGGSCDFFSSGGTVFGIATYFESSKTI